MKKYGIFLPFLLLALLLAGCGQEDALPTEQQSGIFFYDEASRPLTGWQDRSGSRYYLGSDGQALTGIREIDGETYFFRADGTMATGWTMAEGKTYYLRSNGTLVTGWFSYEGQRYYLTPHGAAVGIQEIEGDRYVFDGTGKLTSGWAFFGDSTAYGDKNCHPLTGWQEIEGKRYYFNEAGILSAGWITIGSFDYYFLADGSPAQGKMTIDGVRHWFASNGQELALVNPDTPMPEDYTVELVSIGGDHQIAAIAYDSFQEMMEACRDAGLHPAVCSSYRTQEYQEKLYERKVDSYLQEGYGEEEARELAGHTVAYPGTSEHQLGLALDLVDNRNWNLDESQAETETQKWLMENSWRYGWILRYPDEKSAITGIIYEPWHYRYVGKEIAKEIYELDMCLEEYLMMLTPGVG